MISELWNTVDVMESKDVKTMINEIKAKGSDISLEERIQLYFGLLKVNYIDNALYQLQMIYDEITYKGLTSEFVTKHPDLKIALMSGYRVEERLCGGGYEVYPHDECDDCAEFCVCGGCIGLCCCFSLCCDQDLTCLTSACDPNTGACCNCEEGGCCCKDDGCCDCCCCCGCCGE